ncbi:LptF/LptG family permease [bacterium]|nr:LptF/LptG family permease [bacterium]
MGKLYLSYFISEIIKTFLLGFVVFISIIFMVQFLQLTEFILIHHVSLAELFTILINMATSFLPMIFPMSLLFSILLTYSRLSADSEIIAFQSLGYSLFSLILPAIIFSILIFVISYETVDSIGPISRKKFDDKIQNIDGQKIIDSFKAKTFSENFFGLTLYFNEKIDSNRMQDLFIKDHRDPKHPKLIISQSGVIETNKDDKNQSLKIRLQNGFAIDESNIGSKVTFNNYELDIQSPIKKAQRNRDTNTYTFSELENLIKSSKILPEEKNELII